MFFLPMHMWLWLLLAALSGALIGWALRCRRCARETESLVSQRDTAVAEAKTLRTGGAVYGSEPGKISDLERQLASERDEIAGLKAKLAAATASSAASESALSVASTPDNKTIEQLTAEIMEEEDSTAVQWRNRYLESRVRFLEGKLADTETNENGRSGDGEKIPAIAQQDELEVARLKWRNRYLEGRVQYLEEDGSNGSVRISRPSVDALGETSSALSSKAESIDDSKPAPEEKSTKKKGKAKSSKKAKKTGTKRTKSESGRSPDVGMSFLSIMEQSDSFVAGDKSGKPPTLTTPVNGVADNLREISGVGPKLEKLLHELGVYHFSQIALWTDKEIDWVDERLTFKGRIRRENWIDQCKQLVVDYNADK